MARFVGINDIALEVGDLDAALQFYGRLFDLELRGRIGDRMAFLDAGDQFIALSAGSTHRPDADRHFGLVVDDRESVRAALAALGIEPPTGPRLSFRDPWGNHVEVVEYRDVQFAKTDAVLGAMGLEGLEKSNAARRELREKGLDP